MQQSSYEVYACNNLQRVIVQINEAVHDVITQLVRLDEQHQPIDQSKIQFKRMEILTKQKDYMKYHQRVYEESVIQSMVRQLQHQAEGLSSNQLLKQMEQEQYSAREEQLQLSLPKLAFTKRLLEGQEMFQQQMMSQQPPPEVQILNLKRLQIEPSERSWYLTFWHSLSHYGFNVYDLQVSPTDPTRDLQSTQKIKLDSELVIYRKLNSWFRKLYFGRARSSPSQQLQQENVENFYAFLDYVVVTMSRLFGPVLQGQLPRGDLTCNKCRQYMKLGINKEDGFLPPYMLMIINNEEVRMYHEQCLLP